MTAFIPKRFEHVAFGFLLTCIMTFLISGISTVLAVGMGPGILGLWFAAWMSSWAVAFPSILVAAPVVRRVLARIVKSQ